VLNISLLYECCQSSLFSFRLSFFLSKFSVFLIDHLCCWCRIHLWFRLMGGLQAKSMTSQRYRAVTRWRICVTMATLWQQQDGGYALLFSIYLDFSVCLLSSRTPFLPLSLGSSLFLLLFLIFCLCLHSLSLFFNSFIHFLMLHINWCSFNTTIY